jgi:hypothetical protein
MANLVGASRLQPIYDANDFDATKALVSLSSIAAVTEFDARESALLPPPEQGYSQFSIAGLQFAAITSPAGGLARVRWVLTLEWERKCSPWDALL